MDSRGSSHAAQVISSYKQEVLVQGKAHQLEIVALSMLELGLQYSRYLHQITILLGAMSLTTGNAYERILTLRSLSEGV